MKWTKVEEHFDTVAKGYDVGKQKYSYYYQNLKAILRFFIPPGAKVLEVGCGTGDLLASLDPKKGYGQDISSKMVTLARLKYKLQKNLSFSTTWPSVIFDYIFMSDVIEHLERPQDTFRKIHSLMGENSVFINTMANPLWEPLLLMWEKAGWKMDEGPHYRASFKEIEKIVNKAGMRIVKHDYKLLIPVKLPLITSFLNNYLEKYFKRLAFVEYFVAVKV